MGVFLVVSTVLIHRNPLESASFPKQRPD